MKIRRTFMILALAAMTMGVMTPAGAGGLTAEKLDATPAWACQTVGDHLWNHCFNQKNGNGKVFQVRVFGPADLSDGYTLGDPFLGTEILVHESVYNGQPCSTDGGDPYVDLVDPPYFACHHFATPTDHGH